jgi:hypothetical protein
MPRTPKPFVIAKRSDSNTFQFTLNQNCGLQERVCDEWRLKSFQDLPSELIEYRTSKDDKEAEASVIALIVYLKTSNRKKATLGVSLLKA